MKTRIHRARLALRKELAEGLPERPAGHPTHERRVCLDLLRAKQEAMDRGEELPLAASELCDRCNALFSTLDLTRDTCVASAAASCRSRCAASSRPTWRASGAAELPAAELPRRAAPTRGLLDVSPPGTNGTFPAHHLTTGVAMA